MADEQMTITNQAGRAGTNHLAAASWAPADSVVGSQRCRLGGLADGRCRNSDQAAVVH